MRKIASFLLVLVLVMSSLTACASSFEMGTLTENMSSVNCLAICLVCADQAGLSFDATSVVADGNRVSAKADAFTIAVEGKNGTAIGVTVSAAKMNPTTATKMGTLFGMILRYLGEFDDLNLVLNSLDLNVFDSAAASKQTLVFGNYKIILENAPTETEPYKMSLYLASITTAPVPVGLQMDAAEKILTDMNAEISGCIVYNEQTDPNKKLGKADGYTAKLNFALASITPSVKNEANISVDDGGTIEVFNSPKEAVARQKYVNDTQLTYFGYMDYSFVWGNAYIRISKKVSYEEAGKLIGAFINAVDHPVSYY